MKKMFVLLCMVLFAGATLFAQGIRFESGSWDEALAKAKAENKLLFVDVYTSWCGPCKRMAREVFTRDKVGAYYNSNFVNYQLDAEKGVGPEVKERYGVEAYPTFLFLDGDGKLICKLVGYYGVREWMIETEKVYIYARHGGFDRVMANYDSGEGGPAFWQDYYERATGGEIQYVLRKYLLSMSNKELFTGENGKLVEDVEYDRELYARITKGLEQAMKQGPMFNAVFTYPFMNKIGNYLLQAIGDGNEKWFNELMALKSDLDQLPGLKYTDLKVGWGESFLHASSEFIRLCFYQKNMSDEEAFQTLVVEYMDKMLGAIPLEKILEERLERQKPKKMTALDSSLLALLPEAAKKQMNDPNTRIQAALWEYRMIANTIVDWTNYYWQVAPAGKVTRERCVKWLNYACGINPANPEAPVNAAALLVHLNCKKDALRHIEEAMSQQRKLGYDDIRQVRRLELMLRDVKEGKL